MYKDLHRVRLSKFPSTRYTPEQIISLLDGTRAALIKENGDLQSWQQELVQELQEAIDRLKNKNPLAVWSLVGAIAILEREQQHPELQGQIDQYIFDLQSV